MPRPTFVGTKYQPKNKPQAGGVPEWEGRPVDARLTLGTYMQAAIEVIATENGVSQSVVMRDLIRQALAANGTVFLPN